MNLKELFSFRGRMSRKHYLIAFSIGFALVVAALAYLQRAYAINVYIPWGTFLLAIAPSSVRRLHDIGYSGWFFIGPILFPPAFLLLLLAPGETSPDESGINTHSQATTATPKHRRLDWKFYVGIICAPFLLFGMDGVYISPWVATALGLWRFVWWKTETAGVVGRTFLRSFFVAFAFAPTVLLGMFPVPFPGSLALLAELGPRKVGENNVLISSVAFCVFWVIAWAVFFERARSAGTEKHGASTADSERTERNELRLVRTLNGSRSMRTAIVIALVSLLIVVVLLVSGEINRGNMSQTSGDAAMATKAVELVSKALQEDAEIKFKLGRFLKLSGSGYRRATAWVLIERIEVDREAQFERGTLAVRIIVPGTSQSWSAGADLAISKWGAYELDQRGRGFLEVWVGAERVSVADQSSKKEGPSAPPASPPNAASLSKDAGRIFVGYNGKVEVWDRSTRKLLSSLDVGQALVQAIEPSMDGTKLAVACENGSVKVLDIATGAFTGTASWHCMYWHGPNPVALSQDGSVLVAPSYYFAKGPAQIAVVTHLPDQKKTRLVDSTQKSVSHAEGVRLSPDARYAVAKYDNSSKVAVWSTTAEEVVTFMDLGSEGSEPHDLAFTPRSGRLISASRSRALNLSIWEIPSGGKKATLEPAPLKDKNYESAEETEGIFAINREESLLAFGLMTGRVRVWDLNTSKFLGTISEKAWTLEGSVANPAGLTWEKAKGSHISSGGGRVAGDAKKPAKRLMSLGFDEANRIVALSFTDGVCWIWSANALALQPDNTRPDREHGVK